VWRVLAQFLAAESARADGWGQPRTWLAEAIEVFAANGLGALAERASHQLKTVQPNPWAAEGITDREADVLRLVSRGLANKEVAGVLGVSPRTVEKHVESLLRKTSTRTRTELALHARSSTT
jgi:DNA-binding NarL/FixJ family response regulator